MTKPTELLKEEHKLIKLMLIILAEVCLKIQSNKNVPLDHLEKILHFIRFFADNLHHGKEEDILFPALEQVGVSREGGPLCVMFMEHQMGRDYVSGMMGAIELYRKNDTEAGAKFVFYAKNYISLLNQHIEKENSCLFPMADTRLSEETQRVLVETFKKVDRQKISQEDYETLKNNLAYLKEIYSPKADANHLFHCLQS